MNYAGKTRRKIWASLLAATCLLSPVSAKAETLAQTLVGAYDHSGLLEQNRALLRAADENVAQIVGQLRPIISYTADITRTFGNTESSFTSPVDPTDPLAEEVTTVTSNSLDSTDANIQVTLSLLLFDFGATRFQKEAAKETVLSTRETLRGIEQLVLLRGVTAHMNVIRTQELANVRANNLRLLREELRAAQDRFQVGEVTRTDVAFAEAALAGARSEQAVAKSDLAQAIEEYRSAIGRPPGNLRRPSALPSLSGDIEGAKLIAVRNHPDIRSLQHDISSAELTVKAAQAALKPQLNLQAQASISDQIGGGNDNTQAASVGVALSGPIYQGGILSSAIRQAMAQRDAVRGDLHQTRHDVAQDVGNAYALLDAAQASRKSGAEQVRAARIAFEGIREEAQLGARTTLDVLDAEQQLLDAQATVIGAEVDLYIAAYTVLETIGQLTAKDLRLDVRTYDPAAYYNLVKDAPTARSPQGKKLDRILRALGKE